MYTCIMLLKYEKENMAVEMGRAAMPMGQNLAHMGHMFILTYVNVSKNFAQMDGPGTNPPLQYMMAHHKDIKIGK